MKSFIKKLMGTKTFQILNLLKQKIGVPKLSKRNY